MNEITVTNEPEIRVERGWWFVVPGFVALDLA